MDNSTFDCVIVKKCEAKRTKNILECRSVINSNFKLTSIDSIHIAIPLVKSVSTSAIHQNDNTANQSCDCRTDSSIISNENSGFTNQKAETEDMLNYTENPDLRFKGFTVITETEIGNLLINIPFTIEAVDVHKLKIVTKPPLQRLQQKIESLLQSENIDKSDIQVLMEQLPTKYEIYGDLILFTDFYLLLQENLHDLHNTLTHIISTVFNTKRVAVKSIIHSDQFRTPKTHLVLGDNGWVQHVDNGIRSTFDITKTMFSKGNISEKLRIGKLDCTGQVVVDMFAGIGYFTLPYLIHANAQHVYACEWNPDAVQALKRNLSINCVDDRCTVLEGDNRMVSPKNVADRVNLGLIPSSKQSWRSACEALKSESGGWLHVHANVDRLSSNYCSIVSPGIAESLDMLHTRESVTLSDVDLSSDTREVCSSKNNSSLTTDRNQSSSMGIDDLMCQNQNLQLACVMCQSGKPASGSNKLHSNLMFASGYPFNAVCSSCNEIFKGKKYWLEYAHNCIQRLSMNFKDLYATDWLVRVGHVEFVKSYAPNVDHVVLDVECRPYF